MKRNTLRRLERDKTAKNGNSRKSARKNITTMWESGKSARKDITTMWESGKSAREKIMTGCLIACAVIWTLVFVLDFAGGINSVGLIVMHGIFALVWIAGTVIWILWKRGKS